MLAPALQALLDADEVHFLDTSERSLAEAMLRDEDWQQKAAEAKAAASGADGRGGPHGPFTPNTFLHAPPRLHARLLFLPFTHQYKKST